MNTVQLNGTAVNGKANTQPNGKAEIKAPQSNGNVSTANKAETKPEDAKKVGEPKSGKPVEETKPQTETPKADAPKTEPTKLEIKEKLKEEKPALNLEKTIKLALDLNRRINQRGKLLETINTLESFEVAQQDDAEETDTNFFPRLHAYH